MYTCASCGVRVCLKPDQDGKPKNCPMHQEELNRQILEEYKQPEVQRFFTGCSYIEKTGAGRWPRVQETIELCRHMGYERVGMAFCNGLRSEAKVIADLFRANGIALISVICKTGGTSKEVVGIPEELKLAPGCHETMCNPIGQARLLNDAKTQLNLSVGLCVGHDALFNRYSDALVTTLITKDRVLAHNPAGAVYCDMVKNKLLAQASGGK